MKTSTIIFLTCLHDPTHVMVCVCARASGQYQSLPAPQSVVQQGVEYVAVEGEEDGHAEELVPVQGTEQDQHEERDQNRLHGQQPGVDVMTRAEEDLERERRGGREGGRERGRERGREGGREGEGKVGQEGGRGKGGSEEEERLSRYISRWRASDNRRIRGKGGLT